MAGMVMAAFVSQAGISQASPAGATWVAIDAGSTETLLDVSFVGPKNGWIAGGRGSVLATSNGGATWSIQHTGATDGLSSVFFVDSKRGHAAGRSLVATSNGGRTWEQRAKPVCDPLQCPQLVCESPPECPGANYPLNAVSFSSPRKGYAVGDAGVILVTSDGGRSWKHAGDPAFGSLTDVSSHRTTVLAVGTIAFSRNVLSPGSEPVATQPYAAIASINGGKSWAIQESDLGAGLFGVFLEGDKQAFAVGAGGKIISTSNGGKNWNALRLGAPSEQLTGISFSGTQIGLAVGLETGASENQGRILLTRDGGSSWTRLPKPKHPLHEVAFTNNRTAIAVGNDGSIIRIDVQPWRRPADTPRRTSSWILVGAVILAAGAALLRARRRA